MTDQIPAVRRWCGNPADHHAHSYLARDNAEPTPTFYDSTCPGVAGTDTTTRPTHIEMIEQLVEFANRQLLINQAILDRLTLVETQLTMLAEGGR